VIDRIDVTFQNMVTRDAFMCSGIAAGV